MLDAKFFRDSSHALPEEVFLGKKGGCKPEAEAIHNGLINRPRVAKIDERERGPDCLRVMDANDVHLPAPVEGTQFRDYPRKALVSKFQHEAGYLKVGVPLRALQEYVQSGFECLVEQFVVGVRLTSDKF